MNNDIWQQASADRAKDKEIKTYQGIYGPDVKVPENKIKIDSGSGSGNVEAERIKTAFGGDEAKYNDFNAKYYSNPGRGIPIEKQLEDFNKLESMSDTDWTDAFNSENNIRRAWKLKPIENLELYKQLKYGKKDWADYMD